MKKTTKLIITFCLLSNIFSQEKGHGFGFTFNGGNSILNIINMLDGGRLKSSPTVYYIHNLSNGKRIEPSLGYISVSNGNESSSITTLGVGYLANKIQSNNFLTYWGGRFSMNMFSKEDTEDIISISPVCGAEYSFSDNFSIGGETRFNYTMNVEFDIMDISSHLFFRFYN